MTDPQRPVIQINIYLGRMSIIIIAWLSYRQEIMEFLRSIADQTPF